MATTLLSLKTQSRQRADQEDGYFIADSELTGYINASSSELYDILVGTFSDYYTAEQLTTIAVDGYQIAIPSDFYKLRGLDRDNGGNWTTLRMFNFEDRNKFNNAFPYTSFASPGVRYRVFGQNILIEPRTSAPGDYRLYYIPAYTPMTTDSDTFDGINGWEEYVVVDAAIKMMQKEESDPSVLISQKKALMDRIEAMASNRSAGDPEVITDMQDWSDNSGWGGW